MNAQRTNHRPALSFSIAYAAMNYSTLAAPCGSDFSIAYAAMNAGRERSERLPYFSIAYAAMNNRGHD